MNNTPNSSTLHAEIIKFKKGSIRRKIIEILAKYPDGLTLEQMISQSGLSYKQFMGCKTKIAYFSNLKVLHIDDIYKLEYINPTPDKSDPSPDNDNNNDLASINSSYKLLSPDYINRLKALPEIDKQDVLEMLKKAYYYQKSAINLIEANELISSINK